VSAQWETVGTLGQESREGSVTRAVSNRRTDGQSLNSSSGGGDIY